MNLVIRGATAWRGWLRVPIVDEGASLDDATAAWVAEASARLEQEWPGMWPGEHRAEALAQLADVLRDRQGLPDPLVFHVWPTPMPVGAVVRFGIMEAASLVEVLPTGVHDVLDLPGLGQGIRMTRTAKVEASDGGAMDLASESIVLQDGEGAVVVTVAGTVAFMLAAVRPGLLGLLEGMTAAYEDGRPFRAVLPEGIEAPERWELPADDLEEAR